MAVEKISTEWIDQTLHLWTKMLEELHDIADEWDEISDTEQVSWSLDWQQFILFLEDLNTGYRSSQMNPKQQAQYKDLLSKLKEVAPILKKLNIAQPPASVAESVQI